MTSSEMEPETSDCKVYTSWV